MNKYIVLLIFYLVTAAVYFICNKIEPPARDGGLGLGGFALLVGAFAVFVYFIIAVVKGFSDKEFFLIALIHLIVLLLFLKQTY